VIFYLFLILLVMLLGIILWQLGILGNS